MKLRSQLPILAATALPLLGVTIAPSFAQSNFQLLTQRVNCDSPQTTTEMNICAGREYQVADRKLNSVYQALRSKLSRQQQKRMTNAQLVWIKFRDATCAYERGQFEGVQWQALSELLAWLE